MHIFVRELAKDIANWDSPQIGRWIKDGLLRWARGDLERNAFTPYNGTLKLFERPAEFLQVICESLDQETLFKAGMGEAVAYLSAADQQPRNERQDQPVWSDSLAELFFAIDLCEAVEAVPYVRASIESGNESIWAATNVLNAALIALYRLRAHKDAAAAISALLTKRKLHGQALLLAVKLLTQLDPDYSSQLSSANRMELCNALCDPLFTEGNALASRIDPFIHALYENGVELTALYEQISGERDKQDQPDNIDPVKARIVSLMASKGGGIFYKVIATEYEQESFSAASYFRRESTEARFAMHTGN